MHWRRGWRCARRLLAPSPFVLADASNLQTAEPQLQPPPLGPALSALPRAATSSASGEGFDFLDAFRVEGEPWEVEAALGESPRCGARGYLAAFAPLDYTSDEEAGTAAGKEDAVEAAQLHEAVAEVRSRHIVRSVLTVREAGSCPERLRTCDAAR